MEPSRAQLRQRPPPRGVRRAFPSDLVLRGYAFGVVVPRLAIVSGFAALAAASLALVGFIDLSIPFIAVLLLAARAAARYEDPAALARLGSMVPLWVAVCLVGTVRAGASSIVAARGANAVAGLALVRGSATFVAASWLALLAGIVAAAWITPGGFRRLDLAGTAVQLGLVVSLFAGPHVISIGDAFVWVGAFFLVAAGAIFVSLLGRRELIGRVTFVASVLAVALAFVAPKL